MLSFLYSNVFWAGRLVDMKTDCFPKKNRPIPFHRFGRRSHTRFLFATIKQKISYSFAINEISRPLLGIFLRAEFPFF